MDGGGDGAEGRTGKEGEGKGGKEDGAFGRVENLVGRYFSLMPNLNGAGMGAGGAVVAVTTSTLPQKVRGRAASSLPNSPTVDRASDPYTSRNFSTTRNLRTERKRKWPSR